MIGCMMQPRATYGSFKITLEADLRSSGIKLSSGPSKSLRAIYSAVAADHAITRSYTTLTSQLSSLCPRTQQDYAAVHAGMQLDGSEPASLQFAMYFYSSICDI
jgi:hypothetical protein